MSIEQAPSTAPMGSEKQTPFDDLCKLPQLAQGFMKKLPLDSRLQFAQASRNCKKTWENFWENCEICDPQIRRIAALLQIMLNSKATPDELPNKTSYHTTYQQLFRTIRGEQARAGEYAPTIRRAFLGGCLTQPQAIFEQRLFQLFYEILFKKLQRANLSLENIFPLEQQQMTLLKLCLDDLKKIAKDESRMWPPQWFYPLQVIEQVLDKQTEEDIRKNLQDYAKAIFPLKAILPFVLPTSCFDKDMDPHRLLAQEDCERAGKFPKILQSVRNIINPQEFKQTICDRGRAPHKKKEPPRWIILGKGLEVANPPMRTLDYALILVMEHITESSLNKLIKIELLSFFARYPFTAQSYSPPTPTLLEERAFQKKADCSKTISQADTDFFLNSPPPTLRCLGAASSIRPISHDYLCRLKLSSPSSLSG